jgi:DNA-binding transcriptional LysR family regulator
VSPCVERSSRRTAGRNFYERAKRSIEEAEEAELAARGAGATLSGRLRVCAPVTFARLQVVPRLPAFLAEHPAIDLDMVLDDRNIDLIEAGIDVALRLGRQPDSTLTARKIAECRAIVVGAPAYLDAMGTPRTRPTCSRTRSLSTTSAKAGRFGGFAKEQPRSLLL